MMVKHSISKFVPQPASSIAAITCRLMLDDASNCEAPLVQDHDFGIRGVSVFVVFDNNGFRTCLLDGLRFRYDGRVR